MADPRGFLAFERRGPTRRPIPLRVLDWREVYEPFPPEELTRQAARCMDCGIPFCHEGCPLGNLIPEWNDLVYRGRVEDAVQRLHGTNNFPELTGRLCPAPCEGSCVLGINDEPVLIKQIELEIAERAVVDGVLAPGEIASATGKSVAVVGSGPAGLAAAQQLTRAGHEVVVYERAEKPGGLLRYGIPEFKLEKAVLDRRLAQMEAEGTTFSTRTAVGDEGAVSETPGACAPGASRISLAGLLDRFDAVVLAGGATRPRDLEVPGRHLSGVKFAMDYQKPANLRQEASGGGGRGGPAPDARGRRVVIIGGGDTGADCLGTVHRQQASSVAQLEILPEPPERRAVDNPWPTWPVIARTSSAHEEGGKRAYSLATTEILGDRDGNVRGLRLQRVEQGSTGFVPVAGGELEMAADLVLLALGFLGPERDGVVSEAGLALDRRGNVAVGASFETSVPRVFACGDMVRGQSLIVWAIAEGRSAAAAVDRHLTGRSRLPAPVRPGQLALG